MGTIWRWPVAQWKHQFGCTVFFETGTYKGDGVNWAKGFDWDEIHSVELLEQHYDIAKARFEGEERIKLHLGESVDVIREVLPHVRADSILWWLDAHLPDWYVGGAWEPGLRFPLVEELKAISDCRDISNDVFVIDDWRLYEKHPYRQGMWREMAEGASDVRDALMRDHVCEVSPLDEGYLIATPRREDWEEVPPQPTPEA